MPLQSAGISCTFFLILDVFMLSIFLPRAGGPARILNPARPVVFLSALTPPFAVPTPASCSPRFSLGGSKPRCGWGVPAASGMGVFGGICSIGRPAPRFCRIKSSSLCFPDRQQSRFHSDSLTHSSLERFYIHKGLGGALFLVVHQALSWGPPEMWPQS